MSATAGGGEWFITPQQWTKYQRQFAALNPVNGLLSGEQTKGFLLSSGQPPTILAQIWNLADVTKDGMLDQLEFAIAMFLLEKKHQGVALPTLLPQSLLTPVQMTNYPNRLNHPYPAASYADRWSLAKTTLPQPAIPFKQSSSPYAVQLANHLARQAASKAKYTQMFCGLSEAKSGFLNGKDARTIFCRFGLSNDVLAHIWFLSDLDKDGRLTCEEFCLAMSYIDSVKDGEKLPPVPLTDVATVGRLRHKSLGSTSVDSAEGSTESVEEFKPRVAKTFEDKRRENFEKGQAELERRREQLLKMEQQEREERERKEREEQAKRERERMEAERRRQLELEKELARQREVQLRQGEEHRKMMEQREAARRELERQRLVEWEKMRLNELSLQRQAVVEGVCHSKQQSKNLTFQVQAFSEKATDLNSSIAKLRQDVYELTNSFGQMKAERDANVCSIEEHKNMVKQLESRLHQLEFEKRALNEQMLASRTALSLSEPYDQLVNRYNNKLVALEGLKKTLIEIDAEVKEKEKRCAALKAEYENLRQEAQVEWFENQELIRQAKSRLPRKSSTSAASKETELQQQEQPAVTSVGQPAKTKDVDEGAWPTGETVSSPKEPSGDSSWVDFKNQPSSNAPVTVRYRALYEFVARTEDELSFQPGDIIFVFKNHECEPGWLAGQIKDKVGWFPEAFAECLDNVAQPELKQDAQLQQSHPVQKLESINEESFEREEGTISSDASRHNAPTVAAPSAGAPAESRSSVAASTTGRLFARALYNWKGKTENHLSFSKGSIIRILEQQEMWWKGELGNKQGWFPKSYVKINENLRRSSLTSIGTDKGSSLSNDVRADTIEVGNDSAINTKVEETTSTTVESDNTGKDGTIDSCQWYVAVYSFIASEPGDLAFNAGDKILVLQKDSQWWTGRIGDSEGIFPANYVKPLVEEEHASSVVSSERTENESEENSRCTLTVPVTCEVGEAIAPFKATESNQLPLEPGDIVRIRTKSPAGWWEGELENGGGKRLGWFPASYVKVLKASEVQQHNGDSRLAQSGKQCCVVEACYDYSAAQEGELTFKQGDLIDVVEKPDNDWWLGQLPNGQRGLFPVNYVKISEDGIRPESSALVRSSSDLLYSQQPSFSRVSSSLSWTSNSRKRNMHFQELLRSESNYVEDLIMVRDVFQRPMIREKSLSRQDSDAIFVNWSSLIKVSRQFIAQLNEWGDDGVGKAMLYMLPQFDAFATFGKHLRSALDYLDHRLTTSVPFRAAHARCCSHSKARGLPLNYFLLIPMTRFTKYPLVLKELIKYTPPSHPDFGNLEQAIFDLRALCDDVNRLASQAENLHMLHWCQCHIRCDSLLPTMVFNASTNRLGPRKFIHSGILYKAKSNRLLVGFLFNDFLMLTTPDEPIGDPSTFKVHANCESIFSLYKKPLMLSHATLNVANDAGDDSSSCQFSLSTEESTVHLKAISGNARMLWKKQLDAAINQARQRSVTIVKYQPTFKHAMGRISVEVQCVRNLPIPSDCRAYPVLVELKVGDSKQLLAVDPDRKESPLCSAQFLFESLRCVLSVQFVVELQFSPSIIVGETSISIEDMIRLAGPDRNPVVKQLSLTGHLISENMAATAIVLIKFSVNVFNE
ncbi:SH3 domain protein [Trichuris suis]|nr:SH3 domain protein [Trichuris suis]